MIADASFYDYVHPGHFMLFVEAARKFDCHILVRKTGAASISWMGKPGYTGKRGDLKAKTADLKAGRHPVAGLVCSPLLRPDAFTSDRLNTARKLWMESRYLITETGDHAGFDDRQQPTGCRTPYLVQTNPNHPHYGCVALVESGLFAPCYVHGDYDLFAIIPAGKPFDVENAHRHAHEVRMGTTVAPGQMGLAQREKRLAANFEGPLVFRVSTFLNVRIAATHPDPGALMVNHGEVVSWRKKMPDPTAIYLANGRRNKEDILEPAVKWRKNASVPDPTAIYLADGRRNKPDIEVPAEYEDVLAVMPRMVNGQWGTILPKNSQQAFEDFYLDA